MQKQRSMRKKPDSSMSKGWLNKKVNPAKPRKDKNNKKLSATQRKTANQSIMGLLNSFPGKSIIQILPLLVKAKNWIAVQVSIERIEYNRRKELSLPDILYIRDVKMKLKKVQENEEQGVESKDGPDALLSCFAFNSLIG